MRFNTSFILEQRKWIHKIYLHGVQPERYDQIMKPEVQLIPILNDNYVFCFNKANAACLVDPGESEKCLRFLFEHKLSLETLLITHHHADHIDGVRALKKEFPGLKVYAPLRNKDQIPHVDQFVTEGDLIRVGGIDFEVIELPGHTLGHVGFYSAQKAWLFSGDVVFGLGCGRLFEGTPQTAFKTLQKIKALPPKTKIFCTHEYTGINMKFVHSLIERKERPKNFDFEFFKKLSRDFKTPSVPLSLETELRLNPFLLAENVDQFAALREARNHFRP